MAQEESMFGPTPLAIQDQLDQQFLQRNSNLDLGSMSARAGLAMGNGINGLLGREDPRVSEAKQVQEAVAELRKSGVDMSNPEEYYKKMAGIFGAKGLTAQAEKAAMKALEYQDKQAERAFKTEDRKAQLEIRSQDLAIKNAQLQKEMAKANTKAGGAQLIQYLKDGFATAQLDQESIAKALAEFNREGGTLESAVALLKNKAEKTPEQWGTPVERNVNGKVVLQQQNLTTKEWKTLAGNEANISTRTDVHAGMTLPQDWAKLRGAFTDEAKPFKEGIQAVSQALSQLRQAGTNPQAAEAARTALMKAFKIDSNPTKEDIRRQLNAGALDDRLIQSAQSFFTGTLTDQKIKDMNGVLSAAAQSHQKGLQSVKKNWSKLPIPEAQKGAVDFITSTDAEDNALTETTLSIPDSVSQKTKDIMKKYGVK